MIYLLILIGLANLVYWVGWRFVGWGWIGDGWGFMRRCACFLQSVLL